MGPLLPWPDAAMVPPAPLLARAVRPSLLQRGALVPRDLLSKAMPVNSQHATMGARVISAHGMRMGCLAAAPMCLHKERASERGMNTLFFCIFQTKSKA